MRYLSEVRKWLGDHVSHYVLDINRQGQPVLYVLKQDFQRVFDELRTRGVAGLKIRKLYWWRRVYVAFAPRFSQ